jgi:hypothetical protein
LWKETGELNDWTAEAARLADPAETDCGGVITPAVRGLAAELAERYPEKDLLGRFPQASRGCFAT